MMSSREYSMLLLLILSGKEYRITTLATYYGVTARVIYYNIENLERYVHDHFRQIMIQNRDGTVWLQCDPKLQENPSEKNRLVNQILDDANYQIILNQEERKLEILYRILTGESVKIPTLIEVFDVSKSTVIKDLEQVKQYFQFHNIVWTELTKNRPFGQELFVRMAAAGFMAQLLNNNAAFYRMVQEPYIWKFRPYSFYIHVFVDKSFSWLAEIMEESMMEIDLPHKMFCNCLCGILISQIRDYHGYHMTVSREQMNLIRQMPLFNSAQRLIEKIGRFVSLKNQKNLAAFVALTFAGVTNDIDFQLFLANKVDFKILAANLICTVGEKTGIRSNQKLVESIQTEIYRICVAGKDACEYDSSEVIDMIREDYQRLWNAVEDGSRAIANLIHHPLMQKQIAGLVLNFVELYDLQDSKIAEDHVLIVCNGGVVSSRLICRKLQNIFQIRIVGCVSIYEMNNFLKNHSVDFIITTVPILECGVSVIQVSSYLSDKDIDHLKHYFSGRKLSQNIVYDIVNIVEDNGCIYDKNNLIHRLSELLGIMELEDPEKWSEDISKIIDRRCICLDLEETKLLKAVEISGNMLVKSGKIDDIYVKEIIENTKVAPQYMVIHDEVLMPHSRPSEHVYQTAVSVVRLKNPVFLDASGLEKIRWIFTLVTVNQTAHITALTQLSQIVGNEKMMKELEQISSTEVFLNRLDEFVSMINRRVKGGREND